MILEEIKKSAADLSPTDRRKLIAYLVSLRNHEPPGYQEKLAAKIDDQNPNNWISLEEFDRWASA